MAAAEGQSGREIAVRSASRKAALAISCRRRSARWAAAIASTRGPSHSRRAGS